MSSLDGGTDIGRLESDYLDAVDIPTARADDQDGASVGTGKSVERERERERERETGRPAASRPDKLGWRLAA